MLVNECIHAVLLTILEFSKYFIAYKVILRLRKSRQVVTVGIFFMMACVLQVLVIIFVDSTWVSIIILGIGILIPMFFIEGSVKERMIGYLLIVPGVSIIDILGSTIISYVYDKIGFSNGSILLDMTSNMTSLIVLMIFYFVQKNKGKEYLEEHSTMSTKQYLIIGSGILSGLLILAGRQAMLKGDRMTMRGERAWYLASVYSSCMYVVLSIYQILTANSAKSYKKKNEHYEEFMKLQEDYIKHVISNDKTLRSFRHDIHYHLTAIREYSKMGQYDEMDEYLDSIENYSGLYSLKKYTGNTAVDAIIGEIVKEAEESNIRMIINGTIPDDCNIEAYDLCTITSNLLKNAVEASAALKERSKAIQMEFYSYDNRLFISVKNNVEKMINIKNNELVTSKTDRNQHGFGIYNMKSVVEKYGGTIDFSCSNYVFETQILM